MQGSATRRERKFLVILLPATSSSRLKADNQHTGSPISFLVASEARK